MLYIQPKLIVFPPRPPFWVTYINVYSYFIIFIENINILMFNNNLKFIWQYGTLDVRVRLAWFLMIREKIVMFSFENCFGQQDTYILIIIETKSLLFYRLNAGKARDNAINSNKIMESCLYIKILNSFCCYGNKWQQSCQTERHFY